MSNQTINTRQGHWILAKMGKKVLRPGGKELTQKLIQNLRISNEDHIVEFAPGLGFTASIALKSNPKSYTGIELNEEAAQLLRKKIQGVGKQIVIGNAASSGLKAAAHHKVYGEAMLTMQANHRKTEIIKEAHRILQKGGYYGIHELGLTPDGLPTEKKAEIQRELAQVIKVNARPLTVSEWKELLEREGFKVINVATNPMHLLEPKRVLNDEGFFRTFKIAFNVLTHPNERKRILAMRRVFTKYQKHLNAVSIVAEKL